MTRNMLRSIFRSATPRPAPPPSPPPPTELTQHNQAVLRESDISHVTLPPMFVTWRHPNQERSIQQNGLTHEQAYSAACIVTTRMGGAIHPLWRLILVEQPLEALGRCQVMLHPDNWLSGQTHRIIIQRQSPNREQNNKLFLTEIRHSRYALRLETGQFVPILKLTNPCLVLQGHYTYLDTRHMDQFGFVCDHGRELVPPTLVRRAELQREALQMAQRAARTLFEFANSPEPTAPEPSPLPAHTPLARRQVNTPPPPSVPRRSSQAQPRVQPQAQAQSRPAMPQHIVNTVIETLIIQEKECPITQDPLVKETTCLTPCGHAMTTDAAARWIRDAHSCPECRSHCSVDQLQVWRA